jgi:C4-dicarboxylate transporter DctQ subunit
MKLLRFIDNALARVEGWLIVIFLGLMVASTLVQDWAEPFARLLVLWLTFLGASLVTGEGKHIKIDLLSSLLPRKSLPFRELVLSIVSALICALLLVASWDYVTLEMSFGGHLFLKIPTWVGQLILPAGFSMILFRFLLRGLEQLLEIFRGAKT